LQRGAPVANAKSVAPAFTHFCPAFVLARAAAPIERLAISDTHCKRTDDKTALRQRWWSIDITVVVAACPCYRHGLGRPFVQHASSKDMHRWHNVCFQFEEEEEVAPGGARVVPEEMLQTDTRVGLTSEEVLQRRRKFGLNQMKEEKENLLLKFLGFFVGPIQFVMEVRFDVAPIDVERCFVSSTVAVGATTRGRSRRNETMPFPTSTPTRLWSSCMLTKTPHTGCRCLYVNDPIPFITASGWEFRHKPSRPEPHHDTDQCRMRARRLMVDVGIISTLDRIQ
jgi:hypothetical protein